MDMTQAHLHAPLRGTLLLDEPMSAHVSWRAGGRAERCYTPADLQDLMQFLSTCTGPVHFVGLGSNLLVRDGGLKGTVILLHGALSHIRVTDEGLVYAEAGVSSPKVASFAAQKNLEGAEFLSGIPGTVGGALFGNAGQGFGGVWTGHFVASVEAFVDGKWQTFTKDECGFGYRMSVFKQLVRHAERSEPEAERRANEVEARRDCKLLT